MKRRNLLQLGVALLSSVWAFLGCAGRQSRSLPSVPDSGGPTEGTRKRLSQELTARAQRNYAEEGIPMFLLCENRASDQSNSAETRFVEGRILAQQLRDTADVFQQLQPRTKESDLSKLLEVLAERDFGTTVNPPHRP